MCGLLTFGAGTASAAEPPDIAQLVAAMQQEGQNAAEKAAFTGGGYRASLARAAETAAQAAAAAPVSAPAQEDPGETGGDEEPSEPAPVTQHSIHDENGYYVHNGSAYNSITKDGLWVGGTDENTGFHVDNDGDVTTTGSITVNRTGGAGSVTIDASTGKITGLADGEISDTSTDAVTGKQLNDVKEAAEELDGLAVKYTDENKTAVDLGSATLTTTGAVTGGSFAVGDKTYISDAGLNANSQKITNVADGTIAENSTDAVNGGQLHAVDEKIDALDDLAVKYTDEKKTAVDLGSATLTTTGAITGGSFEVNGKTYISGAGLNANSQKITNVADGAIGTDSKDAVNGSQLQQVYDAMKEIDGTTYADGDGISISGEDNKISVNAGKGLEIADDKVQVNLKGDEKNLELLESGELTLKDALNVTSVKASNGFLIDSNTSFTSDGLKIGGKTYVSSAGLNANGSVITGVSDAKDADDAVNLGQLNEKLKGLTTEGTKYKPGSGIKIDGDTISAKVDENKNLVIGENGIALKDDISVASVTTTGNAAIGGTLNVTGATTLGNTLNVTGATTLTGALTANGAATFTQGASMGGQKITNVKAGEANTDAVNKSQLDAVQSQIKNYAAGDGINIGDGNTISVKYGNGLGVDNGSLTVKADPNGNVEVTSAGIDLKDSITLTGKVTAAQGLYVDNDTYFSNDGLYLSPYAKWTMTDGLVLNPYTSLTDTSLKIGGSTYISDDGLNANNKVISNVLGGKDTNDAVNFGQLSALQEDFKELNDLAVTYDAANKATITLDSTGGTKITNVAAGDISKVDSTDAVNGGQLYATNQIVGNGKWNTGSNYLTDDVGNLTDAANALDSAIGNNRYTGDNVLNANTDGKTYTSVTAAISALDSNIGNLTMTSAQAYYSQGTKVNVTAALDRFSSLFGPMNFSEAGAHYINNDANVSSALMIFDSNLWRIDKNFDAMLQNVGFRKEGDEFTTTIDWSDSSYGEGTTIVTAIKDLDDRVLTLEGKNPAGQSLSAFSKMSTANVSALSALSNMDTETAETLASMSSEQVETLAAKAPAAAPAAPAPGDPTATSTRPGPDGESETGDTGDAYEVKQNLHVTGNTQLDGALTVAGAGTFNDGLTVNTKTKGGTALTVNGGASIKGTLNMNGNKITGVADGEISETSTDAVNGSQLWGVQQDIENNASAIASLGGQVSRLDNRIDRVGAGAAALAALHPLDYDPEVKWDFAAGYGNYRGANAVSVGAFYRPNEDVMFSVGGSMGGGENMVNAGVSFKLGSGSGLTTSRTAMARELAAMKDTVAAQNAQIEAQAKQIEELTALVAQLAAEKAGAPEEKKA